MRTVMAFDRVQHNTYDVEFYGPKPLCGDLLPGSFARRGGNGPAAGDVPRPMILPAVRSGQRPDRR